MGSLGIANVKKSLHDSRQKGLAIVRMKYFHAFGAILCVEPLSHLCKLCRRAVHDLHCMGIVVDTDKKLSVFVKVRKQLKRENKQDLRT